VILLEKVIVVWEYLRIVVSEAQRQFGNPEEEGHVPLEVVTRELMKIRRYS
jgi:hypothetical protein